MPEALHSFIVSVSGIVCLAALIPIVEMVVRRLRREETTFEQREIVQLTPGRSQRRSTF